MVNQFKNALVWIAILVVFALIIIFVPAMRGEDVYEEIERQDLRVKQGLFKIYQGRDPDEIFSIGPYAKGVPGGTPKG